jgi:hypothetical protein
MGDLVTVFKSGDELTVSLAASILEEEGIACVVRNQGIQDLFGMGRIGAGFNVAIGPVEVTSADVDRDPFPG